MEPEHSLPHSQVPTNCPYPKPIRSSPYPQIQLLKDPLILSSRLPLGLPSGLFPSSFATKILCRLLLHTCYMPRPSHSPRFYHPNNIRWAVLILKVLIMYFSPLPCYLMTLRPKYSPLTLYSQAKDVPTFRNYCGPLLQRSIGWCSLRYRWNPRKGRMNPFLMSRCSRR